MDYIIGDVQGCYDTLQELLKKIEFNEDRDRLFFLGDVVNRGNKSLETLRFIYSLKENVNIVLGNHDFHLLVCALTSQKPNELNLESGKFCGCDSSPPLRRDNVCCDASPATPHAKNVGSCSSATGCSVAGNEHRRS